MVCVFEMIHYYLSSFTLYLDANNLYGWAISQKLPVDGFKWVKDILLIMKSFKNFTKLIKNYDEESDLFINEEDLFLK